MEIHEKLLEKSKEAFIMGFEIYNKPTLKYRVEGFSFFICNAWELMLKAHLLKIKGSNSIYYKDTGRTLSLESCVKEVFTHIDDPLRKNLEKIIELRNTSTHYITEEYEMVYIPLFQACIFNFVEKIQLFHEIDMTELIPQNFLTLSVSMKSLDESELRVKYPEEIVNKIINSQSEISNLVDKNNGNFAIRVEHHHFITKDISKATSVVKVDKDAESPIKIIKELKDPNDTHKYNAKKCIEIIKKRLKKENINLEFNNYTFTLFCKYFNLKENKKYCYKYNLYPSNPTYSYSQATIDFIITEIKKDPEHIVQNLKIKK